MEKIGQCPSNMTKLDYDIYMINCQEFSEKLDKTIQFLMHFIFEGKCVDRNQWDTLFMNVCKAVFLKDYLQTYVTNIGYIASDFLSQFEDWHADVIANLN